MAVRAVVGLARSVNSAASSRSFASRARPARNTAVQPGLAQAGRLASWAASRWPIAPSRSPSTAASSASEAATSVTANESKPAASAWTRMRSIRVRTSSTSRHWRACHTRLFSVRAASRCSPARSASAATDSSSSRASSARAGSSISIDPFSTCADEPHLRQVGRVGQRQRLVDPLEGVVGPVPQHERLRDRRHRPGPLLVGRQAVDHGDQGVGVRGDHVEVAALVGHPGDHGERLGLGADVVGLARQRQPALGVGQGVVEQARQPGRPRRHGEQVEVAGNLVEAQSPRAAAPGRTIRAPATRGRPAALRPPCRRSGPRPGRGGSTPRGRGSAPRAARPAPPRAAGAARGRAARPRPPRGPARGGSRTGRRRSRPAAPGRPRRAGGRSGRTRTAPVTAARRSNDTRRPSTAAARTMARTSGSRSSSSALTSSDTVHGSGASSSPAGISPAADTSSSRKNGFPPVRTWRASTARNDGSWSNTAARKPLTSAGVRRSRWTWVTRCRRSRRGTASAAGWRRDRPSGR